jgi:hypothetical protein
MGTLITNWELKGIKQELADISARRSYLDMSNPDHAEQFYQDQDKLEYLTARLEKYHRHARIKESGLTVIDCDLLGV